MKQFAAASKMVYSAAGLNNFANEDATNKKSRKQQICQNKIKNYWQFHQKKIVSKIFLV